MKEFHGTGRWRDTPGPTVFGTLAWQIIWYSPLWITAALCAKEALR